MHHLWREGRQADVGHVPLGGDFGGTVDDRGHQNCSPWPVCYNVGMTTTTPMTADQLVALNPSGRCELVAGVLRMMSPSGWRHGDIVGRLHVILGKYILEHDLGMIVGAETGFLLARNPDTVRAPDVGFIAHTNIPQPPPKEAFWPGAPDLAVEVISPGDKSAEVKEKMEAWLTAGTKLLWKVDGKAQSVTVYRSLADVRVLTVNDILDGGEIVQGFRCPVSAIFNLKG